MNDEIKTFPLLALRDVVVYPHMQIALHVGRSQTVEAVNAAELTEEGLVFVVSQKDSEEESITQDNLYQYGTVCRVLQVMPHDTDDNCIKVLIEGQYRAHCNQIEFSDNHFTAQVTREDLVCELDAAAEQAAMERLKELFGRYAQNRLKSNAREVKKTVSRIDGLLELVYFVATRSALSVDVKQSFIETSDLKEHLSVINDYLAKQTSEEEIEQELQDRVREQMDQNQREYVLNEKMKAIQRQLNGDEDDDVGELAQQIEDADLPDEVRKKAQSEFKKLKSMPPSSSESSVIRGYIDWILQTPWNKRSKVSVNLDKAEAVLNEDHYGLDEVKDRILEFLAVQKRVKKLKGPILCLVGPPGVGKTSLGESIAKATGRKYVRMALGGVRDEAEIRGHRRTYIGAMPGKIVQNLSKVEVKNPLFLLDEIDKMAQDFRGDPASALLEVLDPSQNNKFNDHYLDMDLDLSEVMFVCTANSMNIPPALLDRMEVIRLPGYTEDEKVQIADRYLLPKAIKDNGLKPAEINVDDSVIREIVQRYTREAGVRNLAREISKICRKVVKSLIGSKAKSVSLSAADLEEYLGVHPYDFGLAEKEAEVGRVTGLAWTSVGGELLNIESAIVPGKGAFTVTGSLGDVMKESIKAAMTVVRARGSELGIAAEKFSERDLHVHMPEGATPKDGPSAGLALVTALVSSFTGISVRPDIAMTGEVTLRGRALRIGGLKEKLLAAHRGGIKLVLIPKSNERDLADIPDHVKAGLEIIPVETIEEVLTHALTEQPVSLEAQGKPKSKKAKTDAKPH